MSGRVSRAGAVILHEIAKGSLTHQRPEGDERGLKVMREARGCLGRESRWRKKERKSKDIQEGGDIHIPMADSC